MHDFLHEIASIISRQTQRAAAVHAIIVNVHAVIVKRSPPARNKPLTAPKYGMPAFIVEFLASSPLGTPATILLIVLLSAGTATAQDGHRARGDSLRMAGDLAGAVEAYYGADDADYALASTYALHGAFADSAFHYLERAISNEESMGPLYDPDLYFLTEDARWADIEATLLDKLGEQVSGTFNRTYARELLRMRMKEWIFRYHVMLAYRQLGPESPILTALSSVMGKNHRENEAHMRALIDERGWPRHSSVGEEAAYAAGNVILHADLETRKPYLPLLEAACEDGEANWSDYAHMLDRTELELGNPQVFGTQMEINEETGRYEPRPMVDPERVNERRAAKGMEPIEAQLKRFNESMQRDFGD